MMDGDANDQQDTIDAPQVLWFIFKIAFCLFKIMILIMSFDPYDDLQWVLHR